MSGGPCSVLVARLGFLGVIEMEQRKGEPEGCWVVNGGSLRKVKGFILCLPTACQTMVHRRTFTSAFDARVGYTKYE
jgi:hypothetical protein